MATLTAPMPGTMEQRMGALEVANLVRISMCERKREIHGVSTVEGLRWIASMLEDGDPVVGPMPVGKLLFAVRHVGRERVRKWLTAAGVRSEDRKVRELSERQRVVLAGVLRERARVLERGR